MLEVMRQPLEDGTVCIARAAMSLTFPARFMLAAAMNPCPCGYSNDRTRECHCTPPMIQRYISKISGPLLDRIDIHIDVPGRELQGNARRASSRKVLHKSCERVDERAPASPTCAVPCQQQRDDLLQRADGAAAHANAYCDLVR